MLKGNKCDQTAIIYSRRRTKRAKKRKSSKLNCINSFVMINNYGHPHQETIKRPEKIGCEVYRTDMNGEVDIEVKKDGRIMEKNLEVTKKSK